MVQWLFLIAALQSPALESPCVQEEQAVVRSIALYYSPRCPYCQKVLKYIQDRHLSVPLKNILVDPQAKQELKTKGGLMIVPCLIVNGEAIYDSAVIIDWLSKHQNELS
jgi:glutathione S-transferase